MEMFLRQNGISVVSCHAVQPRRSLWQRRRGIIPEDRAAFRICVAREDNDKLLNEDLWPAHVCVSSWRFKARDNALAGEQIETGAAATGEVIGLRGDDDARSTRCTTDDITQDNHSHRPPAGSDDDQPGSANTECTIMMTDHSIYGDDAAVTLDVPTSQE